MVAKDSADAANVADFAEAARVYAKQAKLGTGAINHATSIKLKAEIRLARCVREGQERGEIATAGQPRIIATTNNSSPAKLGTGAINEDNRPLPLGWLLGLTATKVHQADLIAETFPDDAAVDEVVAESPDSSCGGRRAAPLPIVRQTCGAAEIAAALRRNGGAGAGGADMTQDVSEPRAPARVWGRGR